MYKAIPAFLILSLLPASPVFSAELTDTEPTLTVRLVDESQFLYRDGDGYAVVVGQVVNDNELTPISGVRLAVDFFDDAGATPLESATGGTVLDVIPPSGSSPYIIKSAAPAPAVTQASVSLQGFATSTPKAKQPAVEAGGVFYHGGALSFSGVLKNGAAPATGANVYVAFYDAFDPPRMLDVRTVGLGNILPNEAVPFEFSGEVGSRAVGFLLFSESSIFYSDFVDVRLPEQERFTKLAAITDIAVRDASGNELLEIPAGTTVRIESESQIRFSGTQPTNETPYTYFVQVKQLGPSPYVEFVGKYDGRYIGTGSQYQSVDWIPGNAGEFFIETFVWDRNSVPIAEKGPIVLISVT